MSGTELPYNAASELADRFIQRFDGLFVNRGDFSREGLTEWFSANVTQQSKGAALRGLIKHAWVHSGYRNCGYDQMRTEQKALFDLRVVDLGRNKP